MSVEEVKTPWITWFKEIVTASIGITIILGMFLLLWRLLIKEPPDITNAQGVFSILGGWGGVVLGYYFGRLPAERAATKAEAVATAAEIAKDAAVADVKTTLTETKDAIARDIEELEKYRKLMANWRKIIDEL